MWILWCRYYSDTTHFVSRTRLNPCDASPAMRYAAAAAASAKGCDGHCLWFLPWPLGAAERECLRTIVSHQAMKPQGYILYPWCYM